MNIKTFIFVSVLILSLSGSATAKWIDGYLDTEDDWRFLGRFCFKSDKGSVKYTFSYPFANESMKLLFYYDTIWPSVYKSGKNCTEKLKELDIDQMQLISLDVSDEYWALYSGCKIVYREIGDKIFIPYYECSSSQTFITTRERWWFIVVSKCGNKDKMKFEYSMHLTNGNPDEIIFYEFSADEFYILPTDLAFFILHLVVVAVSFVFSAGLGNRQLLHTTFKMYMASVCLWTFHLFLLCIAYGRYSRTGRSERDLKVAARVFSSASDIIFLLMLLLMASGFTITRGRLKNYERVILSLFVLTYVSIYCSMLILEATMFDEGLVLYIYQSDAGYCLIVLRIIAWFLFVYFISATFQNFSSKNSFFFPFFLFYTFWFYLTPMMILISNLALPAWMRAKTVNGIELFIGATGHIYFLFLTRPTVANKNFPYHIRTSQIGFVEGEASQSGMQYDKEKGPDFSSLFLVSYTHTPKETATMPSPDPTTKRKTRNAFGDHQAGDNLYSCGETSNPVPALSETTSRPTHRLSNIDYDRMFQVSGQSTK